MELGHLSSRSGLTYPEFSSKVCHDSFCQLGKGVSLPWVYRYIYSIICHRDVSLKENSTNELSINTLRTGDANTLRTGDADLRF